MTLLTIIKCFYSSLATFLFWSLFCLVLIWSHFSFLMISLWMIYLFSVLLVYTYLKYISCREYITGSFFKKKKSNWTNLCIFMIYNSTIVLNCWLYKCSDPHGSFILSTFWISSSSCPYSSIFECCHCCRLKPLCLISCRLSD